MRVKLPGNNARKQQPEAAEQPQPCQQREVIGTHYPRTRSASVLDRPRLNCALLSAPTAATPRTRRPKSPSSRAAPSLTMTSMMKNRYRASEPASLCTRSKVPSQFGPASHYRRHHHHHHHHHFCNFIFNS